MIMNSLASFYRDLTCAAGAAVISVVASLTFLTSTAVLPGTQAVGATTSIVQPLHAWFGQPEPAVLVD
jgi:hypothetical protein